MSFAFSLPPNAILGLHLQMYSTLEGTDCSLLKLANFYNVVTTLCIPDLVICPILVDKMPVPVTELWRKVHYFDYVDSFLDLLYMGKNSQDKAKPLLG